MNQMKYISTRGQMAPIGFQDAIMTGLAPDGGLLLPEKLPNVADQLLNAIGSRALGVLLDRDGLPMAGAANVRPTWLKTMAPREPNLRLPPDTRSLPLGGSGQCFACPGNPTTDDHGAVGDHVWRNDAG